MTMREGMLWFDNSERGIAERVAKAATAYNTKYRRQPQLCYVHPSMIPGAPSTRVAGIEIRANNSILPNHFWIGVNDAVAKPATPVRNVPQAGAEVQAQPAKPIKIKWNVLQWDQPFSMLYYRNGALLRDRVEAAKRALTAVPQLSAPKIAGLLPAGNVIAMPVPEVPAKPVDAVILPFRGVVEVSGVVGPAKPLRIAASAGRRVNPDWLDAWRIAHAPIVANPEAGISEKQADANREKLRVLIQVLCENNNPLQSHLSESTEALIEAIALTRADSAKTRVDELIEAIECALTNPDNTDAWFLPFGLFLMADAHQVKMVDAKQGRAIVVGVALNAGEQWKYTALRDEMSAFLTHVGRADRQAVVQGFAARMAA